MVALFIKVAKKELLPYTQCTMKRQHVKALLWDFDGTLVDTLNLVPFALRQSFLYGDNRLLTEAEITALFGPPEDEIIRRHFMCSSAVSFGIELYHQLYQTYHSHFSIYHRRITHLLKVLSQEGFIHIIVTGKGKRSLAISLEKLGITKLFTASITGNDITNPKPNPESLLKGLTKVGIPPEDALMIGDSQADYLAAQALDIPCLIVGWYRTPYFQGQYNLCTDVETLYETITHKNHSLQDHFQ